MFSQFGRQCLICCFAVVLPFSANAASFNADTVLSGVIENVNYASNTLIITNDETGRKETYQFDENTKVIFEGKEAGSRKKLKPGLTVQLKMPAKTLAQRN